MGKDQGGMGGEETIKELHKIDSEVKAVVSRGYSKNAIIAEYERYGFKSAVSKPFSMSGINDVLFMVMNEY